MTGIADDLKNPELAALQRQARQRGAPLADLVAAAAAAIAPPATVRPTAAQRAARARLAADAADIRARTPQANWDDSAALIRADRDR